MHDSTHSILSSLKQFFTGTVVSRLTGLLREIAMATVFGINPIVASFWMAFRFAYLLRRLFGEGALHSAFIPHFESLRKKDGVLGARFFYDLSMGLALILCLIIVIAETGMGAVIAFAQIAPSTREIIQLTMILLPALVFITLYALNSSLLNCERLYFLPSAAPAILNLIWIGALFLVAALPLSQAMIYLSMILVFAFALQWLVTLPHTLRYLKRELGDRWMEQKFSGREIMALLRPFALGILGVGATQMNTALDTLFARLADPEGPAYLWYALRIQQLPLALLGVGLTSALLPPLSRAIQRGEQAQYLHFLNFAFNKIILFSLPIVAATFTLGFSGINVLFGHGAFTDRAIVKTTGCLWAYGAALTPMTLTLVFAAAFYANKNYKIPTLAALLSVFLNIALNALFIFIFQLGALSVALATTFISFLNCLFLGYMLKKKYGLTLTGIPLNFFKALAASALALLLTNLVLKDNTFPYLMGGALYPFSREIFQQLLEFLSRTALFCSVFFIAAYLLRLQGISTFWASKAR